MDRTDLPATRGSYRIGRHVAWGLALGYVVLLAISCGSSIVAFGSC